MWLRLVWDIIGKLHNHEKSRIATSWIKRMAIQQGMSQSEVKNALKTLEERGLISKAGRGKIELLRWRR